MERASKFDDLKGVENVYRVASCIRRRVLEHTIKNNGGYLSQACSSAEIFAALYMQVLKLGKLEEPLVPKPFPGVPGPGNTGYFTGAAYNGPKSDRYDRFFLSPSQYSLVLYATLIETGRMSPDGLDHFNKDGSVVEMIGAEHSPGMEIMTGSLGQGISQAAGIAMARKLKKEMGRVFMFMSDGECQSGQFWEALQVMSHYKLGNMVVYVDVNGYQCDGKVENVLNIEPFDLRLESFGMRVSRIDGHDVGALIECGLREPDHRPTFILCRTDACCGINILKNRIPKLHYVRFGSEEEKALYQLHLEAMSKISTGGRARGSVDQGSC